jgi:endonuclease I
MKKNFTLLFLYCVLYASAAIPTGYYNAAEGKSDAALKTQLSSIISANYKDPGYDGLYNVYKTSDVLPNGKVWDMYSIKADGTANYFYSQSSSDQCGSYSKEGDCYNREHTFCDSWLGQASPQRSDAHHLVPTDGYVNNRRSSYPHGKVGSVSWTSSNGSKLGTSDPSTGYSGTVFEPIDEFKGDFARMYFYVATRYESKIAGWVNNGSANQILAGNSYPAYKDWFYTLMVQWSNQDPVSQKEIDRNNAVYAIQNNRNPYIDYPDLVNYIWGSKRGQLWYMTSTTNPTLTSPTANSSLGFGNVAYLHSGTATVQIKGSNLTGDLTLALSGTSAAKFSLPVTTVTQAQATAGYTLTITYNANAIETSSAVLNVSGGGLTSAVQVNLTATGTDDFMALPANNISTNSFNANWTTSAGATGYTLDVYNMTGTGTTAQTLLEEDFDSGIPGTWTTTGYNETQTSSNVRMASGSQNCTLTTGTLNMTQPTVITVKSKQYSNDTGAKLWVIAGATDTITAFVNSTDYQTFTYNIPSKSNTTLSFYAVKGKRVYFDYVKLTTEGTAQTPVSLGGYPKSVGNVLTYTVNGLTPSTTYYYNVTPEGNSTGKSASITVQTTVSTGTTDMAGANIYCYPTPNGIAIRNLPGNSTVTVMNVVGKTLTVLQNADNTVEVKADKGLYILQVQYGNETRVIKVSR